MQFPLGVLRGIALVTSAAAFPWLASGCLDPEPGASAPDLEPSPPGVNIDWVQLPAGEFQMGSMEGGVGEQPVRRVTVQAFELGRTEVTVGQYGACVTAGQCTEPDAGEFCNWGQPEREDHPINCVDWEQAQAFGRWAGGRLPTEAEWEYAARSAGQDIEYPWGDAEADCSRAVMDAGGGRGCGEDGTWPVCSKSAGNSAQGVCDLAGNGWEWLEDWYGPYGEAPTDGSARTQAAEGRVLRGGGWGSTAGDLRAASRGRRSPGGRGSGLGFRLAKSTP